MSKELTEVQSSYEVATIDQSTLREIFDENQGTDETIGPNDLPRITLPSGKVSVWELPSIQGPIHADSFEGILVAWKHNRAYWPNKYSGQGEPPDCRSNDGIVGIGKPGGICQECSLSKWDGDIAPACTDQRVLFIVRENNILPLVLVLPPTSIPPMRKMMLNLTNEKLSHWSVVIKFALEKDKSAAGIEFSKLKPSVVRVLDPEEQKRVRGYVYLIKGLVQKTHAGIENNQDQSSEEPEPPGPETITEEIELEEIGDLEVTDEDMALIDEASKQAHILEKEQYDIMDKFLASTDDKPDYQAFWMTCSLLGFNEKYIHEYFKVKSITKVDKKLLDVFLRKNYAGKFGEPRW